MRTLPRRAILWRFHDVSGMTGTGHVADIIVAGNGVCAMHWGDDDGLWLPYHSVEHIRRIHGHGGDSVIIFLDELESLSPAFQSEVKRVMADHIRASFRPRVVPSPPTIPLTPEMIEPDNDIHTDSQDLTKGEHYGSEATN